MENLMNKIVKKPNLIEDDALNTKIERIFQNPLFQRIVETADLGQEFSDNPDIGFLVKKHEEIKVWDVNIYNLSGRYCKKPERKITPFWRRLKRSIAER